MEPAFCESNIFKPFGIEHLIPVLIFSLLSYYLISRKNDWSKTTHQNFAIGFSFLLAALNIIHPIYLNYHGNFDVSKDLPFHLCNFLTLIYPYVAIKNSRWLFAILYFWILVGTFQAILTPDLKERFPDPVYFKYWIVHCGLVLLVLHGLFVFDFKIYKKDLYRAVWGANIYLIFSLIVNLGTGGNYFFSMKKPEAASLLDFLGPWPWYLITGQVAMLVLFHIYYLPIHYWAKNANNVSNAKS